MAGCFGSHPEDRARENELNLYLDKQDKAEQRQAMIEQIAQDTMAEGEENYPFDALNFEEALGNMKDAHMKTLAAFARTADIYPDNEYAQIFFAQAVRKLVREYWIDVAERNAEVYYSEE